MASIPAGVMGGASMPRPKYEDGITVFRTMNTTDSAIAAAGFMSIATYDALKAGTTDFNPTTGLIELGRGAIGCELFFALRGSDNNTGNYGVAVIEPVYAASDGTKDILLGFFEHLVAVGVITASALTLGSTAPTALGDSNFQSGDRLADTITNTLTSQYGVSVNSPATDGVSDTTPASLLVRTKGAYAVRVYTDLAASATYLGCFGSRCFPIF